VETNFDVLHQSLLYDLQYSTMLDLKSMTMLAQQVPSDDALSEQLAAWVATREQQQASTAAHRYSKFNSKPKPKRPVQTRPTTTTTNNTTTK
jgi:hypothetical protein